MADAVASQTLFDGTKYAIMKFTNISDGTGEAAVLKVDVSALAADPVSKRACSGCTIEKVWASTQGMSVDILWDATTDILALTIPENQMSDLDFSCMGGLINNAGAGVTGDIMFTTIGHTANDRYTIILQIGKNYA